MRIVLFCMVCLISTASWCVIPQEVKIATVIGQQNYAQRQQEKCNGESFELLSQRLHDRRFGNETAYFECSVEPCGRDACLQHSFLACFWSSVTCCGILALIFP